MMTTGFFWLKIDSTDILLWPQKQTFLFYKMHGVPSFTKTTGRGRTNSEDEHSSDFPPSPFFSIALQSGGLSHQLKALVVSKGYHKDIIINTIANKARRL
jgi:hypothetical protein